MYLILGLVIISPYILQENTGLAPPTPAKTNHFTISYRSFKNSMKQKLKVFSLFYGDTIKLFDGNDDIEEA